MVRYEYKIVPFHKEAEATVETVLNSYGQEGWMVAHVNANSYGTSVLLMRSVAVAANPIAAARQAS